MAFASTPTPRTFIVGDRRYRKGTFTNGSDDSGGDITTGLKSIDAYGVNFTSHLYAAQPKCSVSGGTLTITLEDGVDGAWWALGK